jgi:hypothetical protein
MGLPAIYTPSQWFWARPPSQCKLYNYKLLIITRSTRSRSVFMIIHDQQSRSRAGSVTPVSFSHCSLQATGFRPSGLSGFNTGTWLVGVWHLSALACHVAIRVRAMLTPASFSIRSCHPPTPLPPTGLEGVAPGVPVYSNLLHRQGLASLPSTPADPGSPPSPPWWQGGCSMGGCASFLPPVSPCSWHARRPLPRGLPTPPAMGARGIQPAYEGWSHALS